MLNDSGLVISGHAKSNTHVRCSTGCMQKHFVMGPLPGTAKSRIVHVSEDRTVSEDRAVSE